MALLDWLVDNRLLVAEITGAIFVLFLIQRLILAIRRRRPAGPLHPKLAAYAGKSAAQIEKDRDDAGKVIATSSTGRIAGYELVRQIEAAFVEGYRTPEEAVSALKATAGRKGANAIINLSQQRTAGGRCTAQGDAVVVQARGQPAGSRTGGEPPR
jgi:uncharacterized protein YbjQ (UPF0145 family)